MSDDAFEKFHGLPDKRLQTLTMLRARATAIHAKDKKDYEAYIKDESMKHILFVEPAGLTMGFRDRKPMV